MEPRLLSHLIGMSRRASYLFLLPFNLLWACGPEGTPARPAPSGEIDLGLDAGVASPDPRDAATGNETKTANDLPCNVQDLLSRNCLSCHGAQLAGGATIHLTDWAQLTAPSPTDANASVAELCVSRMRSSSTPMPPAGARLPASEIDALQAWIDSGMPEGSCATRADDPLSAAPTCTTATFWTGGDKESPAMHPGRACIDCHTRGVRGERGPSFAIAGTVFATGHEPDDCNGVNGRSSAATVEITDANGRVTRLSVNNAGNFYQEARALAAPYTARVLYQGRTRSMLTPQTSGDCNSCHTQSGADGAPGRIALP